MTTPRKHRWPWGLAAAAVLGMGTASLAHAAAPNPCGLLTDTEVAELVTRGRTSYSDPKATTLGGGAGAVCQYEHGQTGLWMGPGSEARFEQFLTTWKQDKEPRQPVSGVGDTAYIIYPRGRSSYSDEGPFLVARVGPHVVTAALFARKGRADGMMGEVCRGNQSRLSEKEKKECVEVLADLGEKPESLQPAVVELARALVANVRSGKLGQ